MSLAELRERGREVARRARRRAREALGRRSSPTTAFTFVYTSGTTGPPKGVVLTHENIVWECDAMRDVLPVDESDEQLLFLPLAHIFAKILEWVTIAKGSRIAFAESIAKIKDNLGEVRPTFMCAVPRVLEKVYIGILGNRNAAPPAQAEDLRLGVRRRQAGVQATSSAIEPIPLGLSIKNALATKLVFAQDPVGAGRAHPLPRLGRRAAVARDRRVLPRRRRPHPRGLRPDRDHRRQLRQPPREVRVRHVGRAGARASRSRSPSDGEILIRGGSVMKEYYGKPEATARGHRRRAAGSTPATSA